MHRTYVISDDQYFSLGVASVFNNVNPIVIHPHDILEGRQVLEGGVCYLYLKNRVLHRMICRFIRHMPCNFIFFLPNAHCDIEARLMYYFWPAKIEINVLRKKMSQVSLYYNYNSKLNSPSLRRMDLMSQGLEEYIAWVKNLSKDAKIIHRHYRSFIKSVGIKSVSVHNLFLAEYIAISHMLMV